MKLKKIKLKSVSSTNDVAINLIKNNCLKPSIIIADEQTKGRGTMGKKWISKKGNLFISIYFEIDSLKLNFDKFAILNPHIIRKIISKYSKYKINIKWPNDLFINQKKVCGVLQEVLEFKNKKFLIVGIGVNTLFAISNKKFKSIALINCTDKLISNINILKDFKEAYEKFLTDIRVYKISYINQKYLKEL